MNVSASPTNQIVLKFFSFPLNLNTIDIVGEADTKTINYSLLTIN